MKERGIIFNPENREKVRLGTKTLTSRIIKNMPKEWHRGYGAFENNPNGDEEFIIHGDCGTKVMYGRYRVGDHLYIRETFGGYGHWLKVGIRKDKRGRDCPKLKWEYLKKEIKYDFNPRPLIPIKVTSGVEYWRKIPAIYMPKSLARTWVEVTEVWVNRLEDMTERDCIDEGIHPFAPDGRQKESNIPYMQFQVLWESIHGKGSWEKNPYVFRYRFKLIIKGELKDVFKAM